MALIIRYDTLKVEPYGTNSARISGILEMTWVVGGIDGFEVLQLFKKPTYVDIMNDGTYLYTFNMATGLITAVKITDGATVPILNQKLSRRFVAEGQQS